MKSITHADSRAVGKSAAKLHSGQKFLQLLHTSVELEDFDGAIDEMGKKKATRNKDPFFQKCGQKICWFSRGASAAEFKRGDI